MGNRCGKLRSAPFFQWIFKGFFTRMNPVTGGRMQSSQEKRSRIAPESIKTKRAREKLRKQWNDQDLLITESALADTVDKIHKWIAANAVNRVRLKEKDIRLFDQNQNAAVLSQKVQQFAKRLYEDLC
jgi:hypothetical protein